MRTFRHKPQLPEGDGWRASFPRVVPLRNTLREHQLPEWKGIVNMEKK